MSPAESPQISHGRPGPAYASGRAGQAAHDRPPPELLAMAGGPGGGGAPGYGAGSGAAGGASGAPPLGKFGTLRVMSGNDQGKVIELNRPTTSVGRGADQMLVIADIAVSRRHLQIQMTPTGYRMQDMGSPNGTMVNGKRVAEVQLMDGDQIELGNSLLRFEHPPSRPQPEAPPPVAPAYAPPMQQPMQQPMGYPPPGYPPQAAPGYPMQQMAPQPMMPAGYPPGPASVVQPLAMAPPVQAQSMPQPSLFMEPSAIAMSTAGPLAFLQNQQKQKMYFGALGGALLVGLIGLGVTSLRSGNPAKAIDKATELYIAGTKDFTASHYDTARKAFEEAQKLAPDSAELKHYIEACDAEEKTHKLIEAAKKDLEDRKYAEAIRVFARVEKNSVQYEDAQQQVRSARREAVKEILGQANNLARNDTAAALEKVNKGLEDIDPDNSELQELKSKLSSAPTKAAPPPEDPPVAKDEPKDEKPEKPAKPEPKQTKAASKPEKTEKPEPSAGGDLASNKQALAAYKSKDFASAISAMKSAKGSKAAQTVKDLEEVKAKNDQGSKAEGSNPSAAATAYKVAADADKRLGGALASYFSGKISAMSSKGGGSTSKAPPVAGGDPGKDAEADKLLGQAKGLVSKNPAQARTLCRKVMQLYNNSPKNPKVQEAYRLLNSIKGGKDDDDDF